jgi:hypothetical protein
MLAQIEVGGKRTLNAQSGTYQRDCSSLECFDSPLNTLCEEYRNLRSEAGLPWR